MAGAFWGTRVLEIVKKHDSGGLLWKRIKLTSTRKANAKKRLHRVWQLDLQGLAAFCCYSAAGRPLNVPLRYAEQFSWCEWHEKQSNRTVRGSSNII
ncbi:hypothetical protein CCACVL1_22314 [Corchorus capsularis]|uniref:Uncharacterized protein n=1 Tax=Corchorus capsularis TaxID=210143 RepID=A0A1R3H088_COCAP|nr:hypothetical protein CCACVL1_22314 [Corchorus capsularis]